MTPPSQSSMRFKVERTSLWDDDKPPCEGATKGELDWWDCRTFKSPEEHDAKLNERWHDKGADHQLVYGPRGGVQGIKRNMGPRPAWFVEIASLEALMAFHEKHGDLVVTSALGNPGTPLLEIYDDYRE